MFDRSQLRLFPISERIHDLGLDVIMELQPTAPGPALERLRPLAPSLMRARELGAARILFMGAHVIRSGVQRYLIDLMRRGFISCLAMNGAGPIHDFEFALYGATTESVARYIASGQFGLWRETGRMNDVMREAYAADPQAGLGAALGREIAEGAYPHKGLSLLAEAHRLGVPVTVHIGIGQDIIHEHPNFDPAAAGALSYNDFLALTAQVQNLENGVVMNFGSGVMAPEVYLKALSMARNVAHGRGESIKRFTTLVCDLHDLPDSYRAEPPKSEPAYYFRPWKTMLARTVRDGGESLYVKGHHAETIPTLWTLLDELETGRTAVPPVGAYDAAVCSECGPDAPASQGWDRPKVLDLSELAQAVAGMRARGLRVVHAHGCFDLMHPGHIKYFQAARRMGDALVVTVSADRFVDKGPGRPAYTEALRAESIAALECVDLVAVNPWPTAVETLRRVRPDVYVKGQEFETLTDETGKLQQEHAVAVELGIEFAFTHEIVFSSTQLLNAYFRTAPDADQGE
ncbi:MAG: hypothetical protein CVU73_15400 [Deltaproteobacteria bacterium HGW-Deltaproteobacteria-8]|nr:MAG: hypothetical protein CVU73_15400 [Deltaproteobacteria bacterium HGW-Deltaproteobacteria-8]